MSKFQLSNNDIKKNIESLQGFMKSKRLDGFYISSFDDYLNEYVPLVDNHRYYLTGFAGSTAEVIVPQQGRVKLYVDGRYHEQADIECDASIVEVVKVGANKGLLDSIEDDLKLLAGKNIGIESNRTAVTFFEKLQADYTVECFGNNELESVIKFESLPKLPKITQLSGEFAGTAVADKLKRVFKENDQAYFVTAIDSLAWMTNCRGYHLPFMSTFLGTGLVTKNKVYVFIADAIEYECSDKSVEFVKINNNFETKIQEIAASEKVTRLFIDKKMLNTALYLSLGALFKSEDLEHKDGGLVEFHSVKDDKEIEHIKYSFQRSDKAIFNTIKWVKACNQESKDMSERDLYNQTSIEYQKQGVIEQSFNTISGVGPNGSIIHYGDPKESIKIESGDMILLDSGGYFAPGFATDTTRTFLAGEVPKDKKYKEIYTLVLKGSLNLQNAVFKPGTRGGGLDAICRQPLYQAGYDFAHGTGHGVGIHVHEGGVGISPVRNYVLQPGQVVSIEPGIYIPGFAGVRLENIGLVVEHPKYKDFLAFESLVYIGYEQHLIDDSLLNEQEKVWLAEYEAKCAERGNSFIN